MSSALLSSALLSSVGAPAAGTSLAAASSFGGIAADVVIGICLIGSLVVLIIQWRRMR